MESWYLCCYFVDLFTFPTYEQSRKFQDHIKLEVNDSELLTSGQLIQCMLGFGGDKIHKNIGLVMMFESHLVGCQKQKFKLNYKLTTKSLTILIRKIAIIFFNSSSYKTGIASAA